MNNNEFNKIMEVLNNDPNTEKLGKAFIKALGDEQDQKKIDSARELFIMLALAQNEEAYNMFAESVFNQLNN